MLGTLRYMSPEQAAGDTGAVDHRSDIYSLGATLYELLTLQPAFVAEDRYQLLQKVAHESPVAPRQVNEAIPVGLEAVVLKAMARDPQVRYATAQALADDLTRFLSGEPVLARPEAWLRRTSRWLRRRRRTSAVIVGLLAVALVATVLTHHFVRGIPHGFSRERR